MFLDLVINTIWIITGLISVIGAFMDAISGMAFDFIASGHYAMVVHPNSDKRDEPSALRLSKDVVEWQHKLFFNLYIHYNLKTAVSLSHIII